MNSPLHHQSKRHGAALVTTLIVIVVLAVVVVAFMQNTMSDHMASRSTVSYCRAQLAAEAGVQSAVAGLWRTTIDGPYATIYSRDPNSSVPSPYLFFAKRQASENSVITRRYPLFSSGFAGSGYFEAPGVPLVDTNARNLPDWRHGQSANRNVTNQSDLTVDINRVWQHMTNGLVGLTTNGVRLPIPVNWIYISNSTGEIIGRFAYWTDDECSKLDVATAGNDTNGPWNSSLSRKYGTNLGEVSLSYLTNSSPGGSGGLLTQSQVDNLLAFKRAALAFEDKSLLRFSLTNGATAIADADVWNKLRPYITTAAYHDRRAPDGKLKLNLNAVITASPTDTARIQQEMEAITAAITNNMPEFGARAASDATADNKEFYVRKIAANIRDFVDADSAPTLIKRDGLVLSYPGTAQGDFIPLGTDLVVEDIPAIGKEAGPFLSEYLRIVRVVSESPIPNVANMFQLQVVFAHYVELHNPTSKTITSADIPGGYILLANREPWENGAAAGAPSMLRPPDVILKLPADFSIEANGFAVLTTDDNPVEQVTGPRYRLTRGDGPGQWNIITKGGTSAPLAGDVEKYAVTTSSGTLSGASKTTRFKFYVKTDSATPYQDASERLILGSTAGIVDVAPKIYTAVRNYLGRGTDNPVYLWTFPADPPTSNRNTLANENVQPRFSRGDLLSNMEISALGNHAGATWRPPASGGPVFSNSFPAAAAASLTLGATNFHYEGQDALAGLDLWRNGWKEYTADPAGNHFVANRPLLSIGELGFVYDPSRHSLAGYRSHGATLRMGQSDAGTNNRAGNGTGEYANWLGGRGEDSVTSTNYLRNAFLLADVFTTTTNDRGRVNPNSLMRDGGFVFKSLADGFLFEANSINAASVALAGKTINTNAFLSNLLTTATNASGFVSLGDISLASAFHAGTNLVSDVNMTNTTRPVSDSGKEEFFRRSANLLTTQSLAFTVFSIGQSGRFVGDKFEVSSTAVKEMLVRLVPTYPPPASDFDRVAPERWDIMKLKEMNYQ